MLHRFRHANRKWCRRALAAGGAPFRITQHRGKRPGLGKPHHVDRFARDRSRNLAQENLDAARLVLEVKGIPLANKGDDSAGAHAVPGTRDTGAAHDTGERSWRLIEGPGHGGCHHFDVRQRMGVDHGKKRLLLRIGGVEVNAANTDRGVDKFGMPRGLVSDVDRDTSAAGRHIQCQPVEAKFRIHALASNYPADFDSATVQLSTQQFLEGGARWWR